MQELIKITTNDKGEQLVSGRELHEGLKIEKAFSTWIQTQLENVDAVENVDFTTIWSDSFKEVVEFNGNINSMTAKGYSVDYILTVDIAKEICIYTLGSNRLRKESKTMANEIRNYLIKETGKGEIVQIKTRKEIEFINKLEEALKALNVLDGETQYYCCDKYRIDYYIPSLNIAIEYDENSHENYIYKQQEGRQKEIEKELGCKFIRVTDEYSDEYNLGLVIKELVQEMYDLRK